MRQTILFSRESTSGVDIGAVTAMDYYDDGETAHTENTKKAREPVEIGEGESSGNEPFE